MLGIDTAKWLSEPVHLLYISYLIINRSGYDGRPNCTSPANWKNERFSAESLVPRIGPIRIWYCFWSIVIWPICPSGFSPELRPVLKNFQPIIESAKVRDVNETDTVVFVTDVLQEVFGYDKYTEITTEHNIKGTYCDLAVKIDDKVQLLIEVKAVGHDLKDSFVRQAIDYGANLGVEWVILTTGERWRIYKILFAKPIDFELVFEFNFLDINPKNEEEIERIWMLSREGWIKEEIKEFHTQKQTLNRFVLAALIRSDSILKVLLRELRRIAPGVKINADEIDSALCLEVLKREAIEGEKAESARKLVTKAANRILRSSKPSSEDITPVVETTEVVETSTAADPENPST
ncbi:MAG: type I restriction enzyme HsdR N-terminal domain-containing protein [Gemmataceae bacterium]